MFMISLIIIYKQKCLYSDWLKTCQLMPNQWNVTSATLNRIRFVLYHNIKDNEKNLCQDLLTIQNTNPDLKVHALHYANELLEPLFLFLSYFQICCHLVFFFLLLSFFLFVFSEKPF